MIAVDSQGYLREVRDTHVYPVDWTDKREALQYIHFLKVNEHEMEVLTGLSDPHEAARQLYEWGVKEVLVTLGGMGSLIFDGKDFYRIPAYKPREVVDATGCGDTYTIGYLYQRVSGAGIEEAGRFAAAMSTLKIEKSGPFNGSKEDVIQCMTTAEQMFLKQERHEPHRFMSELFQQSPHPFVLKKSILSFFPNLFEFRLFPLLLSPKDGRKKTST